jgi:hypothetical protein
MNRTQKQIMAALLFVLLITIGISVSAVRAQDGMSTDITLPFSSVYYQVDPFWPKPLPNDWVTGSVGGVCTDAKDNVIIVQRTADDNNLTAHEKAAGRPAPPFIKFDPAGNVIASWGDYKAVPGGIHDCYVDYEGNIWVGGNADAIAQKYSPDGKMLLQIGEKGKFDTDTGAQNGKPLNSSKTRLNRPSGFAVDPSNGDVYISDGYGNRRVVVFDKTGKYLRQFGRQATKDDTAQGVGGVFEEVVHHVALSNDGLLYVSDREGRRIQVFDKQGNFKRSMVFPRRRPDLKGNGEAYWVIFSRDPQQKYIIALNGEDEAVYLLERNTGKMVERWGHIGHMAGEFTYLHSGAMNSKGDLFLAETITGRRVQKFKAVKPLP